MTVYQSFLITHLSHLLLKNTIGLYLGPVGTNLTPLLIELGVGLYTVFLKMTFYPKMKISSLQMVQFITNFAHTWNIIHIEEVISCHKCVCLTF